ncbi:uncharacterized protein (DUF2147 family) [Oxalobacteraceae bacterium GrIS 1.11]
MRILVKASLLALTLALSSVAAWADEATPVGLWKNIDDVSGKPKALIRITENGGVLQGKLEKLFRAPDQDQNPKCDKCEGVNKDQPILGLMFMWGLKKDGNEYNGGEILDPDNGKVYKSQMTMVENGKKLQVRGYIGMPMFGRTQTWLRQEQ